MKHNSQTVTGQYYIKFRDGHLSQLMDKKRADTMKTIFGGEVLRDSPINRQSVR